MATQPLTQLGFDYADLDRQDAEFLREKTGEIRQLARAASESIMLIGAALLDVKERIGHGYFQPWLKAEFNWSDQTARRFMHVATAFKSNNLLDLQIDASALYLLAAPSTPPEVRADVIARAESGEHITHAAAKHAVAEFPAVVEKAMEDFIAKVTATTPPSPPPAPPPPPPPAPARELPKLETVPVFKALSQAEGDWQVDLRDCLNFIDDTTYDAEHAVELAKDFGITASRIRTASQFFADMEKAYGA